MNDSSSDDSELYIALKDVEKTRGRKVTQRQPRPTIAFRDRPLPSTVLHEDSQQMLAALYYWRRKLCSKFFQKWCVAMNATRIGRKSGQTRSWRYNDDCDGIEKRHARRISANAILARHQMERKMNQTQQTTDNGYDSSESDSSAWTLRFDSPNGSSALRRPSLTSISHTERKIAPEFRQKKPLAQSQRGSSQRQRMVAIKCRFTLLDQCFSAWKALEMSTRSHRHRMQEISDMHRQRKLTSTVWISWNEFTYRKGLTRRARQHSILRTCTYVYRTWIYYTTIKKSAKFLQSKCRARRQVRCWRMWSYLWSTHQKWRVLVFYLTSQHNRRVINACWSAWTHFTLFRRQHITLIAKARNAYEGTLRRKYFRSWSSNIEARIDLVGKCHRELCQRSAVRRWSTLTSRQRLFSTQLDTAVAWFTLTTMKACMRYWRSYLLIRHHKAYQHRRAIHLARQRYMNRTFQSWLKFLSKKAKSKKNSVLAKTWCLDRMILNSFRRWKRFITYQLHMHIANLHYYSVTTEKVFYAWHRCKNDCQLARWHAFDMTRANQIKSQANHFIAWRNTAHRLRYLNMLRCRLQIRFARTMLRRHLDGWLSYIEPKIRRRRLSVAFQSRQLGRFMYNIFNGWRSVVRASAEWRYFVCALEDTHTFKRLHYGFHRWRVKSMGVALAAMRQQRVNYRIFEAWSFWAVMQRTYRRQLREANEFRTIKLAERAWEGWIWWLSQRQKLHEACDVVQTQWNDQQIRRNWHHWKDRFNQARLLSKAQAMDTRCTQRRVFQVFKDIMIKVGLESKLRRAAHVLLTGKLCTMYFERWRQYLAYRGHKSERNALAAGLHNSHLAMRALQAWKVLHWKKKAHLKLSKQSKENQLRRSIVRWHETTQTNLMTKWTLLSSKSFYSDSLYRKILYAWSDCAAFRRHLHETTRNAENRMQNFHLRRGLHRLQENVATAHNEKATDLKAEVFWLIRRKALAVAQFRQFSHEVVQNRLKTKRALASFGNRILKKTFAIMVASTQRSRHVRFMLIDALGMQSQAKMKFTFSKWKVFVQRQQCLHEAEIITWNRSLRRTIKQWQSIAAKSIQYRKLMETTRFLLFGRAVSIYFSTWCQYALARRKKHQQNRMAISLYHVCCSRKAWNTWQRFVLLQVAVATTQRSMKNRRQKLVLSTWKEYVRNARIRQAQFELATLHDASKRLRWSWRSWIVSHESTKQQDQQIIEKCSRRQCIRRVWKRWVGFKHHAILLRKVTILWKQRHLVACFRHWNIFRGRRAHKIQQLEDSRQHHVHQTLGRFFQTWRTVQALFVEKRVKGALALKHYISHLSRCVWTNWTELTRKTVKTKQILAAAFRRDVKMTMFRCFCGWKRYLDEKLAMRQRNEELFLEFAAFQVENAIQIWHENTKQFQNRMVLDVKASEFLRTKLLCRYFDRWILLGYSIREKKLKYQLALNHSNSQKVFNRFQRWLEYTYWHVQAKQARCHFEQSLVQKTWIYWLEYLDSLVCSEESEILAAKHDIKRLSMKAWRGWRLFGVHQLQNQMAKQHYEMHTLQTRFNEWRHNQKLVERLRHAWNYWEASALNVKFRHWQNFVAHRRVRNAQLKVFDALQRRRAIRRWRKSTQDAKQHQRQFRWAAKLFYDASLGYYFRAWRSKFESKAHKRYQVELAISHLIWKGLRGYFERWRDAKIVLKRLREAKIMADCHLHIRRQRRGVYWLREHARDHQHAQCIWQHVKSYFNAHLHCRLFRAWRNYACIRRHRQLLQLKATVHWSGRSLRCLFQGWMHFTAKMRHLKARVFRSRHLYFSSLYSRAFFRLHRFALLKRQLRHVTERAEFRSRLEWFHRWNQFRQDKILDRKRAVRASMLYRRSHLKRLYSHWRSVVCDQWMRNQLIQYGLRAQEQFHLQIAVRYWFRYTKIIQNEKKRS